MAGPMTITALLLFLLVMATLVGILVFWDPAPPPLSGRERAGKHRHPDDQDTTRLDDVYLHQRN